MPSIHFKGKTIVRNHHLAVAHHELVPCREKSLLAHESNVSLHDNLIIHGDNLAALKSLLPTYGGKVNCICIDPPYNTGNEKWIYNDRVSNPMMQEWLGKVVDREDMTRHDKWLCMMMPRLKLLRELLAEDGVIFVFIDDNEAHRLRMLMDEIFGEDNHLTTFMWKKKGTSTNVKSAQVSAQADFIHGYAMIMSEGKINRRITKKEERKYPHRDEDGFFRLGVVEKKNTGGYRRDTMQFKILGQSPRPGKRWQIGEVKARSLESKNRFLIDDGVVKIKIYEHEDKDTYSAQPTILEGYGSTDSANKLLSEILGLENGFDNPKPLQILKHLINISSDKDSIILDSCAGSGTTAHAVLELNKEDGGNRQFILVECEDYADSITAERVRRVINGVETARNDNLRHGLGGTFSYFELGNPIEMTSILRGDNLPSYDELARFVFYTATGEEWNPTKMQKHINCIGDSKEYAAIYLLYQPDVEKLKNLSLTLNQARELPSVNDDRRRLVFAPTKFINDEELRKLRIDFCRLPFEIYKMAR